MARWALVLIIVAASLLNFAGLAAAQLNNANIWIDRNSDGLPDTGHGNANTGVATAFDVWVNSNAYQFTYFNVFVKWGTYGPPVVAYYDTTRSQITVTPNAALGGAPDPFDNFSNPCAIGQSISGMPVKVGTQKLFSATLKPNFVGTINDTACVTPLVVASEPFYTFSILNNVPAGMYCTFDGGVVTPSCFTINPPSATEQTSWGSVKGLYR